MSNYDKMLASAQRLFLGYDQGEIIRRWGLDSDEGFLYADYFGQRLSIDRRPGALAQVDAPEERQVLLLDVLKQLLPEIGDGVRPRPAETIVVQVHQPKSHQSDDRNNDADQNDERPSDSALLGLKADSASGSPFLDHRVPRRQF